MTKEREALKLALEALEEAWYHVGTFQPTEKAIDLYDEARTAIKEALAQPEHGWTSERIAGMSRLKDAQDKKLAQPSVSVEQEPVAWMYEVNNAHTCLDLFEPPDDAYDEGTLHPLYTTPPQRNPLTRKEVLAIIDKHPAEKKTGLPMFYRDQVLDIARAIEAAHGIKGEA